MELVTAIWQFVSPRLSASSCFNLYLSIELFELFWINYGHICTWELEQRQLTTTWSSSVSINSQLTRFTNIADSFPKTFHLKIENKDFCYSPYIHKHYEENLLRLYWNWVLLHVSIDVKVLEMTSCSCVANLSCTSRIVLKLPCTSVSMAKLSCTCWLSWTWVRQFPHIIFPDPEQLEKEPRPPATGSGK